MPDRFDTFTERARRVLTYAQEEAQRHQHNYIGPEHLLLGLLRDQETVSAHVLNAMNLSAEKLRAAVEPILASGEGARAGEIGLTGSGKRLIELAVDSARGLNHHYIGTEHLLLGLARLPEGPVHQALADLGVTPETVRAQLIQVLSQRPIISPVMRAMAEPAAAPSEKFDESARKVLTLAQEEAQRFNHNYIGTEHLLLGLLRAEGSAASRALEQVGVSLAQARQAVELIIGRGDRMMMGEIDLTPRAKKVLELAKDEARRLNRDEVGAEHLLLGLIREGEGIAVGVLESLGASLHSVHLAVFHALGGTPSGAPVEWTKREIASQTTRLPRVLPEILHGLRRVLPVGQTRREDDLEITVLSIEDYENGFVVVGRVFRGAGPEPVAFPVPSVGASDDLGTEYRGSLLTGNESSLPEWRFSSRFTPAIPAAAERLRVEIGSSAWLQMSVGERGVTVEQPPEPVASGPWVFDVSVSESE